MTLPNFLVIGAPKAGTTTINYVLDQHPQVFMCPVKESGFFWAYGQNFHHQGYGAEKLINRLVTDIEAYQKLFAGVTDERAIGEASVRYLYMPQTPAIIHKIIPHAKMIAILRHPAEQAFSAFMNNLRDGWEPCATFEEAVAQERQGLRDEWFSFRYLRQGFYFRSLKNYLEFFSPTQLHISLFEDLQQDPQGLMRSIFRFLEVDEDFVPDFSHKHNVSGIIRNPILRFLWTRTNRMRAKLRPLLPPGWRHAISEWVFRDLQKLTISPEMRAELTEYYREDILQLQDLIRRDLSHWLK